MDILSNGWLSVILILAGFFTFFSPITEETASYFKGKKRLTLLVVAAGIIIFVAGIYIAGNHMKVSERQEFLEYQEWINATIEKEQFLPAPELIDNVAATGVKLYLINDTQAAARIMLCEKDYGTGAIDYWINSVVTYGKPDNISGEWIQISKSVIPQTREEFPPVQRASADNGTLAYEMDGRYTYAKYWA